MKNLILFLLFTIYFAHDLAAQVGIEAQVGGANFLGLTVNTRFNIPLNRSKEHSLSPSFGIGMLAPGWDEHTAIINTGLTYNYKSWGIGTEISGFTDNPFTTKTKERDFVDMIVYPNFSHTHTFKSGLYFRISAGPYFAFSKTSGPESEVKRLKFQGDIIPGAGLSVGYLIK